MDPIKLYDYLATGKPIVSTPVPGVDRFSSLIRVGSKPEEFVSKIHEALAEEGGALAASRREAARSHSWEARVKVIASLLRQRLAMLSDLSAHRGEQSRTL